VKPQSSVRIEIPFHDVDAMRIVWHGNYARYFEIARSQLLRDHGLDYPQMESNGWLFPVIRMECRYASPLRYGDVALVTVAIEDSEFKLVLTYSIVEETSGRRVATGKTEHAVIDREFNLLMPVPAGIRDRFLQGGSPSERP
jgi:acyl-CoA thioester hydrolase